MASVDERVVAMSFENSVFEARVSQTQITLGKLNSTLANIGKVNGLADIEKAAQKVTLHGPMSALDKLRARLFGAGHGAAEGFGQIDQAANKVSLEGPGRALDRLRSRLGTVGVGASEGFASIEKASSKVTLAPISSAIDHVTAKFSGLQIAAATALGTIVSGVTQKAAGLGKALSLGPITAGLEEYATNLNSIQTILANTQASGAGLEDVNKALQQLNTYSDQTIYNFSQMAKNIGTFTAAGVDLKTATASIKGIANLAALSGSNSEQASTAMYQLSQAISSGRVSLQDWNSVVNAGMGGTVFQRALAQTAQSMGTLSKGSVELKGKMKNVSIEGESFRESITAKPGEKSWLTSDVLTSTLKQFTGDLSAAEIKAMGFNDAQTQSILKTAETAKKAATEVKTLKGVFDVAKESLGSGWAATFQIIFGNFTQAKKTFTDLSQAISKVIGGSADARNKVLGDWAKLGGRSKLIEGIKAAFEALVSVIKSLKDAFRDIFPRKTGEDLFNLTVRFTNFMKSLKIGPETADGLRRTFAGFFAILHIGITVIKGVLGVIGKLLGVASKGSGGFLNFTGSIGDFIVALDKAITRGGALTGFFEGLASVLRVPIELLRALARAISGLFGRDTKGDADNFSKAMENVKEGAGPLAGILEALSRAWNDLVRILDNVKEAISPLLEDVGQVFSHFGNVIADAIRDTDFNKIMAAVQTTLIGGIFVLIKRAIGKGVSVDFGQGLLNKLSKVFENLTGSLKAMQRNLQASTLIKIAAAIGLLAVSVLALSTIEPHKLAKAMTAVSVGIGQLVGAMALLSKVGPASMITMPFIAAAMIGLAGAVVILAGAVKIFSTMSWEELIKGLAGVAGVLTGVGLATKLIGPSIIPAAAGIGILAIGVNALAIAVKIFGEMDLASLAKGLIGVTAALVGIGLAMNLMPPTMLLTSAGIGVLAIAMIALSGAVRAFSSMNLGELAKGILGAATAIVALGLATALIPPTLALQAAGLVVLGLALSGIAVAVGILGKMKLGTIIKGIAGLGATLGVLAIGLTAMSATFLGSLALLAAAGALAILAPTLFLFGNMPWKVIIKGLAAIALSIGVIGVVGAIAAPALVALGGALVALGLGMSLVSASVYIFAKAVQLLGSEGTKGIGIAVAAITAFIALLPKMIIEFIKGLVEIIAEVAKLAPQVVDSIVKIINAILEAVIRSAPKMAAAAGALIVAFLKVLNDNAGPLITAGWRLLVNFLSGIRNNITHVVGLVGEIIVKFLSALAGQMPRIMAAGLRVLLKWIEGITNGLPRIIAAGAKMVGTFLVGMTQKLPAIIVKAAQLVRTFLNGVAKELPSTIRSGVRVIVAFINGVADAIPRIVRAGTRVAVNFIQGIGNALPRLVDAGFKAVIKFMNGVAKAIRDNDDAMIDAGYNIASAIGTGLFKGLTSIGPRLTAKIGSMISALPKKALSILHIKSPSKVFVEIGKQTMLGMVKGLEDHGAKTVSTMGDISNDVVDIAQHTLEAVPSLLDGLTDMDPVITPILDLSNIERDAQQLSDLTKVTPITAATSFGQAAAISDRQTMSQIAQADQVDSSSNGTVLKLEQNNYSPKALDDIEIYRKTKNQLSQVRSALGLDPG